MGELTLSGRKLVLYLGFFDDRVKEGNFGVLLQKTGDNVHGGGFPRVPGVLLKRKPQDGNLLPGNAVKQTL